MPQVQRVLPEFHRDVGVAGPHMIGETVVDFDADGFATVDDPALLDLLRQWPESFFLVPPEGPPVPPPAVPREDAPPPAATGFTAEELDLLTVAQLQDLAEAAGLQDVSRLRKRELIEAILATQGD